MKKTVTANISGIVFHIDTDAYDKLHNYLSTIHSYFENTEEVGEIISDIEARIAELLKEMLKNEREVVTLADVNRIIEVMGEPEQYLGADAEPDPAYSSYKRKSRFSKKLFRDPDDKVLGGVCSGIGHFFGISSIWIRLIFLLAFFVYGVGFLPYIILWIIMPLAKTAGDKLEMKGEPVTADAIGRTIKDEYRQFKKKVDTGDFSSFTDQIENFFAFLGRILVQILKVLVKLVAFVTVVSCVIFLFVLLFGMFTTPDLSININGENVLIQPQVLSLILDSKTLTYLTVAGLVLLIGIPLLAILYAGLKLFFNIKGGNRAVGFSFAILWVFSILMLVASSIMIAGKFSAKESVVSESGLGHFNYETLYLSSFQPEEIKMNQSNTWGGSYSNVPIYMESDLVFLRNISVNTFPSTTADFQLKVRKKSAGNSSATAKKNAENISYSYEIIDSVFSVNEYLSFPAEDGFRAQQLHVSVGIPLGKQIVFTEKSREIIYDVENTSNMWDGEMIGHVWVMTNTGLRCMDCLENSNAEGKDTAEEKMEETEQDSLSW